MGGSSRGSACGAILRALQAQARSRQPGGGCLPQATALTSSLGCQWQQVDPNSRGPSVLVPSLHGGWSPVALGLASLHHAAAGHLSAGPALAAARPQSPMPLPSFAASGATAADGACATSSRGAARLATVPVEGGGVGEDADRLLRRPSVAGASLLSADEYRRLHGVTVDAPDAPPPFQTFAQAGFDPSILNTIQRAGYTTPTTIQAQAWPVAMSGRDLVAIASTGSGKTCGFLLPAVLAIKRSTLNPRNGPLALVLAPTRELARQIQEEAVRFGGPLGLRNACLYGGAPRSAQFRELRQAPHLVVACPGRLLDFVESGELDLSQVQYLVLDEADRMLDMGFEPQIHRINSFVPRERQTAFFSATWPKEVQAVARDFCRNAPVHVFIGSVQTKLVANASIRQLVRVVDTADKLRITRDYLWSKPEGSRIIIFCGTKSRCDWLAHNLGRSNMRAATIHGDKTQGLRDYAIAQFKSGRTPILVATDVAARGLDIPNVTAVVNFDFPNVAEMYIHRIGRTGRAGATGESFTLFTQSDASFARELVQILRDASQLVPEELEMLAQQNGNRAGSSRGFNRRPGGYGGSRPGWGQRDGSGAGRMRPGGHGAYRGGGGAGDWSDQGSSAGGWGRAGSSGRSSDRSRSGFRSSE